MLENNLAAVMYGQNDLRLEEIPLPVLGNDELLIRPHTTGICGSDMHFLCHGQIGSFKVSDPIVLGHETSGIVTGVGSKVTGFSVGDRVAMEPQIVCWNCEWCKTGKYNLCPSAKFFATAPTSGTLCRTITHPAMYCFKMLDSMSFEEGALLEPLTVAVQACQRANVRFGQNVLILGAGPIGLMCMLVAKAAGALRVVVTDINEKRLETMNELGAEFSLNVSNLTPDEVAKKVEASLGAQPDIVLDCVAIENSVRNAIKVSPIGLMCMLVAKAAGALRVVVTDINEKRLETMNELGAEFSLNVSNLTPDEVAKKVEASLGAQPDIVLDCVAIENSVRNAIKSVKPGGRIAMVGLGGDEMQVPMFDIIAKEIDLIGVFRYAYCYPIAMNLVESGKVDLKKIPVAHYALEQSIEAFEKAKQGDVMKVFIHNSSGEDRI